MAERDLIPIRSEDEAKRKGKKGGIASGEARRKKKDLKECLKAILDGTCEDGGTWREKLVASLVQKAADGDVRAFAEIRDTLYGKPVSTVDMKNSDGSMSYPVTEIALVGVAPKKSYENRSSDS